jgi:signal transduction histidine kinase
VDDHSNVDDAKSREQSQAAKSSPPDAGLSSLLQILRERLHADVAYVSLLNEETQFFLAGARKEDAHSAIGPTNWFGCDQVGHRGGLCERTITLDGTKHLTIYQEFDMAETSGTKELAFVNGTLARFRSYAGAPIKTAAGVCIGTVFTMSNKPSLGLDASQHQLLIDTASHVMRQLTLSLHALEGQRMMQFQSATATLLQRQRPSLHQNARILPRKQFGVEQQPFYVVEVYQHAAEIMRRTLELDGVIFQHVPSKSQTASGNWQGLTLAHSLNTEISQPTSLSGIGMDQIIQTFPRGSVLHRLDGGWYMSNSEESRPMLDPDIIDALNTSFDGSQQLLIMPIFDVLHNRIAAVCFGWLNGYNRVYSDRCDLPFVSGFCMSTMSEVLRLETQMLERVKSDFLGSISHEMKTPLHQTLGNLELLLQTNCSNEQRDLAIDARFGTTQLLETIDKILQYANISSESDVKPVAESETDVILNEKDAPQIIGPRIDHIAGAATTVDLVRMCEEVVEETTKRMRLLETIMTPSEEEDQAQDGAPRSKVSTQRVEATEKDPFTIVIFDASPIEGVQIPRNTGFRVVLENLLVWYLFQIHKFTTDTCGSIPEQCNQVHASRVLRACLPQVLFQHGGAHRVGLRLWHV